MNRRASASALALVLVFGACSAGGKSQVGPGEGPISRPEASDHAALTGAGSTLATATVMQWAQRYRSVAPGVSVDFRAVASDATADDQLRSGAVDFAVSERPDELADAASTIAAVPSAATAVVVTYNLPGLGGLRLSPVTLARIFDGSLTSWNDAAIGGDNPGRALPALKITPVTRSDPSSATLLFSRYLDASAPVVWTAGSGPTVAFAARSGVVGPDALTKAVKDRPGSIGYASGAEATAAGLDIAMVKNSAGHFAAPTTGSMDAFLLGAEGTPDDLVLGTPFQTAASDAYPLSAFSYVFVPRVLSGTDKDKALRDFLRWILGEGQRSLDPPGAAPLPLPLLVRTLEALQSDDLRPRR
jgi:phosphate transport system substrate-binding protein